MSSPRAGCSISDDAPRYVECVRAGPWTGRGADVGVVLDLMIHDLDLVHRLVPGCCYRHRRGRCALRARTDCPTKSRPSSNSRAGRASTCSRAVSPKRASAPCAWSTPTARSRSIFSRAPCATPRGRDIRPLALHDPLGESVAAFVTAVQAGGLALVRPEEARHALETALMIEDAALFDRRRDARRIKLPSSPEPPSVFRRSGCRFGVRKREKSRIKSARPIS